MIFREALMMAMLGCPVTRPGLDGLLGPGKIPVVLKEGLNSGFRHLCKEELEAKDWYLRELTDVRVELVWGATCD